MADHQLNLSRRASTKTINAINTAASKTTTGIQKAAVIMLWVYPHRVKIKRCRCVPRFKRHGTICLKVCFKSRFGCHVERSRSIFFRRNGEILRLRSQARSAQNDSVFRFSRQILQSAITARPNKTARVLAESAA